MKKTFFYFGLTLYAAAAHATCQTTTTPASCVANTPSCSGGYCTTTYKYMASSTTCKCVGVCCTAAEYQKGCLCPNTINGVQCAKY